MRKRVIIISLALAAFLTGCTSVQQMTGPTSTNSMLVTGPDIHDKDKVAQYVTANLLKETHITTKEFLQRYDIVYGDLSGDKVDEAVLVPKTDPKLLVITSTENGYAVCLNEESGHYETQVGVSDGFLKVIRSSGGTGVIYYEMTLYHWRGDVLQAVASGLTISSESYDIDGTLVVKEAAELKGPLNNFEYTLIRKQLNPATRKSTIKAVIHKKYTWKADTAQYRIDDLPLNKVE